MSSLWDVDTAEELGTAEKFQNSPKPKANDNQSKILQDLTTRLEQVEAALRTSETRVEQVVACRKVSDAKVELLESKLKTSEVETAEMATNLKASDTQLQQFKTYLKASDEKVKQLERDLEKAKIEIKNHYEETQTKFENKIGMTTEDEEKMIQEMVDFLKSRLLKFDSKINKQIKEVKSNEDCLRKQLRQNCLEMQEVRKKIVSFNFNRPLTSAQENKVNNDLWEAARQGNIEQIREALDNGADIDCKLDKGNIGVLLHRCSPLLVASSHGHAFAVEYLLLHGSDINAVTPFSSTALHFASAESCTEVISLLLDYGAKINQGNIGNWTPLHFASSHGRPLAVKLLLEKGADASVKNERGGTAYDEAGLNNPSKTSAVRSVFHEFGKK